MPSRNRLQAVFLITWKKLEAARSCFILFFGFAALLAILWMKDSFRLSFGAFLFFFPYLFLFLSQDMFRDEIDAGALESVMFIRGGFRNYLLSKNLVLGALGMAAGLGVFMVYIACGLSLRQVAFSDLFRFLAGLEVGAYYIMLGGCLSFFFKSGANVLIVIIGQICLAIGLFLGMTERHGWVEALLAGSFPDTASHLRFLALSIFVPNVIISRRLPLFILGVAAAGLGLFAVERRRICRLELFRK
jgi:hypothetical protein